MANESPFFPALKRRDDYGRDSNGDRYSYQRYRQAIAEDCQFRCGYCDSHENSVGGHESMQLDHFRPWNKKFGINKEAKFEHLRDDPTNLVHSCRVCNGFKWSHWPTEDPAVAFDGQKGWIEPFMEERKDFLEVGIDGTVRAIKAPASYQILVLRLNRPLLRKQREFRWKLHIWKYRDRARWQSVVENDPDSEHARTAKVAIELLDMVLSVYCPT